MKPPPSSPPTADDAALDRLLARQYRETTPEFEARWVGLKRDLRQGSGAARPRWRWVGLGWGVPLAAAALVVVFIRQPAPPEPELLAARGGELWQLNTVLTSALPLLDDESRAVVLHLPTDSAQP